MAEPRLPECSPEHPVAVVGAGSIGVAFAVVQATAGRHVCLYDVTAEARDAALPRVLEILDDLARFDLLAEPTKAIAARVDIADSLEQAVSNACFIHECAPEDLPLKKRLAMELDHLAPPASVIASASSAIAASAYATDLPGRSRCLVAHPGNPPFLLRVVELVPAPFTTEQSVNAAREFLEAAGLATVTIRKEIKGFVFNRLQGALLREAYCLVRDGVASVEEIDTLVRDGLGLRWSVIGPFETVDLNTRGGIERHAALLGPAYAAMGAERGQHDPWTSELVSAVTGQRRALLPLDRWNERVRWRDRQLMRVLSATRRPT